MKTIQVRNLVIGEGIPAVAVPVMGNATGHVTASVTAAESAAATVSAAENALTPVSAAENAFAAVSAAVRDGADLIELRADTFADLTDGPMLKTLLSGVRDEAADVPVLFTVRTAAEGGFFKGNAAAYKRILEAAAESGLVDLIDIEAFPENVKTDFVTELIGTAWKCGVRTVLSNHSFSGTPESALLSERLRKMEALGADIAKIACMPQKKADAYRMLSVSALAKEELHIPFIAISMGEMGQETRLSGEVLGSSVTFGALPGGKSAPGQMEVRELKEALSALHEAFPKKKKLFLTGFMGCGKSTAARAISELLSIPIVEMDAEIERRSGRSIPEIFAKDGEEAFRELETELIAGLWNADSCVVSTGGGCPLRKENRALMHALGTVACLTAAPETVLKRLEGEAEDRPNIRNRMSIEGIRELMEKRASAYEAAADVFIPTDELLPREIAEQAARAAGML